MKIVFTDTNEQVIRDYCEILQNTPFRFVLGCIKKTIQTNHKFYIVVSPANSHGYMDGGVDMALSSMYPGIQKIVRAEIAKLNIKDKKGRFYLPIGSAFFVNVPEHKNFRNCNPSSKNYQMIVPTMFLPQDITDTDNVYWAFVAILSLMERIKKKYPENTHVYVPGLGTLTGKMTGKESAVQILKAYEDFRDNKVPERDIAMTDDKHFVLSKMACPQNEHWSNNDIV